MVHEPRDYTALTVIQYNAANVAFPGDGVTRNQVETLRLKVGVDVRAEREGLVEKPDGNASRDEWYEYAVNQPGADTAVLGEMTRAQIIKAFSGEQPDPDVVLEPPAANAKKDEWVKYAVKRESTMTEDDAKALTRDELIARYEPEGLYDQEQAQGLQRQPVVDPNAPGQPLQK